MIPKIKANRDSVFEMISARKAKNITITTAAPITIKHKNNNPNAVSKNLDNDSLNVGFLRLDICSKSLFSSKQTSVCSFFNLQQFSGEQLHFFGGVTFLLSPILSDTLI